jgi:hypothetical protein
VAAVIERPVPSFTDDRQQRPYLALSAAFLVAVLLVGVVVASLWWFRGGTFLHAQGGGYGGVGTTNQQYSYGIDLTTVSGPSLVLQRASASYPAGLRVRWSIYRNGPRELGFGSWHGPLEPKWPTSPVAGYRLAQAVGHPERGATWLVASITASRPGLYHVSHITITYRSGRRVRHANASADICVLVAPRDRQQLLWRQVQAFQPYTTNVGSLDPLVALYEQTCNAAAVWP